MLKTYPIDLNPEQYSIILDSLERTASTNTFIPEVRETAKQMKETLTTMVWEAMNK